MNRVIPTPMGEPPKKENPRQATKQAGEFINNLSAQFNGVTNPRQERVLLRLLAGPCDREPLDRVAGSSNSPDVVMRIRKRGLHIDCERIDGVDRDGRNVWFGRYSLTSTDRAKVLQWLHRRQDQRGAV